MRTAAGGMMSQPACQSCAISVAPARPMLVLVRETTRSAPNMRRTSIEGRDPSASAITASTSAAATNEPAATATNVPVQTPGPISAGAGTSVCSTTTVSVAVRANCATLNATLTGALPRANNSTTNGPATWATISSVGAPSSRPTTNGSSDSDSVCALPRMCAWTTKTSVAAKPIASAHQGTRNPFA
jgi:hypothetical protein